MQLTCYVFATMAVLPCSGLLRSQQLVGNSALTEVSNAASTEEIMPGFIFWEFPWLASLFRRWHKSRESEKSVESVGSVESVESGASFAKSHSQGSATAHWYPYSGPHSLKYPLNFTSGFLAHQNLGGLGPDSGDKSIVFKNIGMVDFVAFDLRMVTAPGETWVGNVSKTELDSEAEIASLNMESGTSTKVNVHFINSVTGEPMIVPRLFLTILDIDAGSLEGYGVNPYTKGGIESYTISPVSSYYVSKTHDLEIHTLSHGELNFTATEVGGAADNPTHPMSLTTVQQNRAVMVEIRNQKKFQFTFAASPGTATRNVMFSGPSLLSYGTLGACSQHPNFLDFSKATMGHNNLDKRTDKGPQRMHIKSVMTLKGEPIDLTVKVAHGSYKAYNGSKNGLKGDFVNINLKRGTRVGLSFEFTKQNGAPVYVPDLFFTFADIDQERQEESFEAVTIASSKGSYFLSDNTTLNVTTKSDGFVTFRSTMPGSAKDNPEAGLTGTQKDNAVTLFFEEAVQSFTAYLSAQTKWPTGRNIAFGGDVKLACT